LALIDRGLDFGLIGNWAMYSRTQFAALELMCRERAALAKKETEYSLAEYWLAEAEEWKEFTDLSYPFIEKDSPIAPVT
jgi:hypothetical protein